MRYLNVVTIGIALVLASCGSDNEQAKEHAVAHDKSHAGDHEPQAELNLTLNGEAKWQMDDHTRDMVKIMSGRLKSTAPAQDIGAVLKGDIDKLVQGCTMTGAAHEELHTFLTSYIPAVHEVAETGSDEALEQVTHFLKVYPEYFE